MSIRVVGVIDLPFVNLQDLDTIVELLQFIKTEGISNVLDNYTIMTLKNGVKINHKERKYSYIILYNDGKFEFDSHYQETVIDKDTIFGLIKQWYPAFKKSLEIIQRNQISNYSMKIDKEREKIMITAWED